MRVRSVVTDVRTLPLALLLFASILGACGSQPGVSVFAGHERVPMVLVSTSRVTGWWAGEVGDAFPTELPLTTVRGADAVSLRFEAEPGASVITGVIYDKDAPSPTGGPTEQFTLRGRSGIYAPRTIVAGHTYEVMVDVAWSGLLVRGEETHAFLLKLATR